LTVHHTVLNTNLKKSRKIPVALAYLVKDKDIPLFVPKFLLVPLQDEDGFVILAVIFSVDSNQFYNHFHSFNRQLEFREQFVKKIFMLSYILLKIIYRARIFTPAKRL